MESYALAVEKSMTRTCILGVTMKVMQSDQDEIERCHMTLVLPVSCQWCCRAHRAVNFDTSRICRQVVIFCVRTVVLILHPDAFSFVCMCSLCSNDVYTACDFTYMHACRALRCYRARLCTHIHTHTRAHTHTCVHTRVGPWYQRQCGASEHAVIMQSTSNARLFWTLYFAYGTLELGLWVVMSPFVGSSVLAFCWHFVPLAISPWRTRTC